MTFNQEQKTAVFKMTLESLQRPHDEWMPWILELSPTHLATLIVAILEHAFLPMGEEIKDRLLILLGTLASSMNSRDLMKWAPSIVLARNRKLANRATLPPTE